MIIKGFQCRREAAFPITALTVKRRDRSFNHNTNRLREKHVMKKVKIAFWIVVFGFVGLVIFQNKGFFMAESQMVLNLGFFSYETPFLANAIYFVAFFLVGILISYFFSLFKHFKDAKIIKSLKAKETSLVDTVAALEKQLAGAGQTASAASESVVPPDSEAVVVDADVTDGEK